MNHKISVIVPVYNVEKYLKKCIDSIINQTYTNTEIILIDDGSTDNSGKICDEYALQDSRVIIIHKENGGLSSARNCGLDIANGEFIYFIDSDDSMHHQMLEILYWLCILYDSDISSCNINLVDANNSNLNNQDLKANESYDINILKKDIEIFSLKEVINGLLSQDKVRFEVWNKLFRKSLIGDTRFKVNQVFEDVYFDRNVFLKANKFVYIDLRLYNYLINRKGATNSYYNTNKLQVYDEFNQFSKELEDLGMQNESYVVNAIALNFAKNQYIAARKLNANKVILTQIINIFRKNFKRNLGNTIINKNQLRLFNYFPNLYYFLHLLVRT